MNKKVILWDNDGVLVDTEKYYLKANKKVLAKVGIKLTDEMYKNISLEKGKSVLELVFDLGMSKAEHDEIRAERNGYYREYISSHNSAIDGVEDVLKALHGKIIMGVVTSSTREHFEIIHSNTGFNKYFDFSLAREDYKNSKPSPEPYLLGAKIAKASLAESLAVEDSSRGLTAAHAAGIDCFVIPNELTEGSDFTKAKKILNSIAEIPNLVLG